MSILVCCLTWLQIIMIIFVLRSWRSQHFFKKR